MDEDQRTVNSDTLSYLECDYLTPFKALYYKLPDDVHCNIIIYITYLYYFYTTNLQNKFLP